MKNTHRISSVILLIILITSCEKKPALPIVSTIDVTEISYTSANSGGEIISDGGLPIKDKGLCWETSIDPTINNRMTSEKYAPDSFNIGIINLSTNTTYFVRAFATNDLGIGYGNTVTFKTLMRLLPFNTNLTYSTVNDIDGNNYKTITIGNQTWMAENLKTTKYSNGDLIGTTTPATLNLDNEVNPKYQWPYNGEAANVDIFGRLYTGYAILDSRNVCPEGWHIPSDSEWKTLEVYLGMGVDDLDKFGGPRGMILENKLKSQNGWLFMGKDGNGTNDSGFSALPGGVRAVGGPFWDLDRHGVWWTSTLYSPSPSTLFSRMMSAEIRIGMGVSRSLVTMDGGASVRCLKD